MKSSAIGAHNPTISVLLPVYNAESYIRAAVESVLVQTYDDFELIALDDGSTDNSLQILREYEAQDHRVHLISRENRGLVLTLNELIERSSGRYIARMDADDICLPHRFELQVEYLDANPDHVIVGGWVELINIDGYPIGIIKSPIIHDDIDNAQLKGHTSICHPVAMILKKAMISAGGYRPDFDCAEDLDLWLRLAEIGKLSNIPDVLLQYRLHDNSISEAKGDIQQQAMKNACEQAWHRRNIEGRFEADSHWRQGRDKSSRHKFALKYGWVSWNHKHRRTWWTYACEAIRLRPFALSSWKLLVFGLIKSPPPLENPE